MNPKTLIFIATVSVAVVAGFLAQQSVAVPSPPEWLTKWTTWAITFIGLLKAPGFADAIISRVKIQAGDRPEAEHEG